MKAALVRWELACIALEASSVGLALWFTLGLGFATLGTMALIGICAVSFFVRTWHYLGVKP